MKVALTAWEDKISPVFDSSRTLLVADIENAEIISRRYEIFNPEITSSLSDVLCNLKIDVLICGAISETPARIIQAGGINLIPFIGGNIEEILLSYVQGARNIPAFLMPGCGPKRNKRRKRNVFLKHEKEVRIMPKRDKTGPQGQGAGTGRQSGGCGQKKDGKGTGRGMGRGTGQGRGSGSGQGKAKGQAR